MRSRLGTLFVIACSLLPLPAHAAARSVASRTGVSGMALIAGGWYRPLYTMKGMSRMRVEPFALDRRPVTRRDYLRFVITHREWKRDAVRPALAEANYLADWPTAASAGDERDLDRPVTNVSWFAARAYCAAQGKRLPTTDEWELAGAASESRRDATGDQGFRRRLLALYATRNTGVPAPVGTTFVNAYGVADMHGLVWEWTIDFNASAPRDSHAAPGQEHHLWCASAAIGVADPTNYPAFLRFAVRSGLTTRSTISGVGFRCAANAPV
jgi:formylglycine-generating enzyme required for sulfatase activity